jgi:hypothetical protein
MTYASGVGGTTLVYNLGRKILVGETGTIAYIQPGNGIEAQSGGVDLATFSGVSVVNSSTQTPTLLSATIPSNGASISLVFSQTVQFGAGGNSGWTLNMSGGTLVTANIIYASGSGTTTLVYSLTGRAVQQGETGTIAYSQSGNGVESVSAPNVDVSTIVSASVTNNSTQTAPALSSATVQSSGTTINLVFNKSVQIGSGGSAGWTITMSGGTFSGATLAYASGSGTATLVYNLLGRVVQAGEIGTLSYVQPGNGIEATSTLIDVPSIGSASVTNGSAQGATGLLSWDVVASATSYLIYYGVNVGPPYTQPYNSGVNVGNVTSYDPHNFGLTSGTYHWAVTAIVNGEETAWSSDGTFVV